MNPEVNNENRPVEEASQNTQTVPVEAIQQNTQSIPVVNETQPVESPSSQGGENTNSVSVIDPNQFKGNDEPIHAALPSGVVSPNMVPNIPVQMKPTEKKEIDYTPISKAKTFLLIFFFVVLIAFVIFLPQISTFMRKLSSGSLNTKVEKIVDGRLLCDLKTSTSNLDKNYSFVFQFEENKLKTMKYVSTIRGDVTTDEEALDSFETVCKQLKENVEELSGISVQCERKTDQLIETQNFTLQSINVEEVSAAYIEAGGNMPEFEYDEDMDYIEKNMNASGYTCSREKS